LTWHRISADSNYIFGTARDDISGFYKLLSTVTSVGLSVSDRVTSEMILLTEFAPTEITLALPSAVFLATSNVAPVKVLIILGDAYSLSDNQREFSALFGSST